MEMSQNEIAAIKEKYVPGMRIRCLYMEDERGVPGGTCGTVVFVDDIGTIHVDWDNGSGLGLCPGVDAFEIA